MSEARHFLDLSHAGSEAIALMINDALDRKAARRGWPKGRLDADAPLAGYILAMVFEKASTRTRVSFDVAIRQLGGTALVLDAGTSQLAKGESIADTARVLSRMADAIMLRTDDHEKVEQFARNAGVPVINGLTNVSHPCQIVADLLTIIERGKALPGLEMAWLGDCNNVLNSFIEAAGLMKFNLRIGTPAGLKPTPRYTDQARMSGGKIIITSNPSKAVANADVVVTDTWVSIGESKNESKSLKLAEYRVDSLLMSAAKENALFLHCLPAHIGEEVTAEVFEGSQSAVFDEAENRIHAQKSILLWSFEKLH